MYRRMGSSPQKENCRRSQRGPQKGQQDTKKGILKLLHLDFLRFQFLGASYAPGAAGVKKSPRNAGIAGDAAQSAGTQ